MWIVVNRTLLQSKPWWEIMGSSHLPCWVGQHLQLLWAKSCSEWIPIFCSQKCYVPGILSAVASVRCFGIEYRKQAMSKFVLLQSSNSVGGVVSDWYPVEMGVFALTFLSFGLDRWRRSLKSLCANTWTLCVFSSLGKFRIRTRGWICQCRNTKKSMGRWCLAM